MVRITTLPPPQQLQQQQQVCRSMQPGEPLAEAQLGLQLLLLLPLQPQVGLQQQAAVRRTLPRLLLLLPQLLLPVLVLSLVLLAKVVVQMQQHMQLQAVLLQSGKQ